MLWAGRPCVTIALTERGAVCADVRFDVYQCFHVFREACDLLLMLQYRCMEDGKTGIVILEKCFEDDAIFPAV